MSGDGRDPDAPVVVAMSRTELGAALAVSILEAEGVEAMVAGMHSPAGLPYTPLTSTGSSVLVRRSEHELATETLRHAAAEAAESRYDTLTRCYACGHDRGGIPGPAPCPECGAGADGLTGLMGQWRLVDDLPANRVVQGIGIAAGVLGVVAVLGALAGFVVWAVGAVGGAAGSPAGP